MIRGLYTSGWSMLALSKKMDVVSNNLANANTNGFKKDTVVYQSFPELLAIRINDTASNINPSGQIGYMDFGSDVREVYTNFSQGPSQVTNNSLDFALKDVAFDPASTTKSVSMFTVGVPDGTGKVIDYYTRDGSFGLDVSNKLVTKEGYAVMGENGPITLDSEDFSVNSDGTIVQNGTAIGKLLITSFLDASVLKKVGSDLYEAPVDVQIQPFTGEVLGGYLEQSNVNIINEMIDMITVTRSYEASQKILQAQDGTLEKAVNEVGAVR